MSKMSKKLRLNLPIGLLSLAVCTVISPVYAVINATSPLYGSLSNFDVYNDNLPEIEVHGFEIELHGISKSQVGYSFGSPYQAHYGNPQIVDAGLDSAGQPITKIRYESPYDSTLGSFTKTTLHASGVSNTGGHACYLGGPIGNYETSGCEHFGLGVIGSPSATIYRWLVADPLQPGVLVPVTSPVTGLPVVVNLPAPVWNVPQPVLPLPGQNPAPPVVDVQINAPEVEPGNIFGPALWMKLIKTETEQHVELNHLLFNDNHNPVNDPVNVVETEVEWEVMQKRNPLFPAGGGKKGGGGGKAKALQQNGGQLGAGKKAVTRRYEYFEYTGTLTAEGEADPKLNVDVDAQGKPLPAAFGEPKGVQMVAVNFDSDGDGIDDGNDNCINKSNHGSAAGQRDDDGDGIGNACDAHWANNIGDQVANLADLKIFKQDFGKHQNIKTDLDEDGDVDLNDLKLFKEKFGKPAGQSGKKICNALTPC
ncbi:MAG: hypothetical protein WCS87_14980 [Methylococcaceae bacterium]